MTTTEDRSSDANTGDVDMKLEVVTIPVTDLDRAKAFYAGLVLQPRHEILASSLVVAAFGLVLAVTSPV